MRVRSNKIIAEITEEKNNIISSKCVCFSQRLTLYISWYSKFVNFELALNARHLQSKKLLWGNYGLHTV